MSIHAKKIVIDTGAYMRATHLDRYGERLHTTQKVALEIQKFKDDPALSCLRSIETINIEDPEDSDLELVRSFAKSTGDLPFLSQADISAIALTYKFFRQGGGTINLNPKENIEILPTKFANDSVKSKGKFECSGFGFNKWITKKNLNNLPGDLSSDSSSTNCIVACMTTDYSMQNLLLHMGLSVITVNGLAIKTAKRWGLICRACYFATSNSTLLFCEKCGHNTLDKIAINISKDGIVTAIDKRKYINTRGTIYSIPKQKVGRHANNLILSQDQMLMPGFIHNMRANQHKKKDSIEHLNLVSHASVCFHIYLLYIFCENILKDYS